MWWRGSSANSLLMEVRLESGSEGGPDVDPELEMMSPEDVSW